MISGQQATALQIFWFFFFQLISAIFHLEADLSCFVFWEEMWVVECLLSKTVGFVKLRLVTKNFNQLTKNLMNVNGVDFGDQSLGLLASKVLCRICCISTAFMHLFIGISQITKKAQNCLYYLVYFSFYLSGVGRAIRHIKDYAAILLVDTRYASDSSRRSFSHQTNKLPQWIKDRLVPSTNNYGEVHRLLHQFFKFNKKRELQ